MVRRPSSVRLGNPLSGFFSEDSVAVTVRHHAAPTYTYTDGVLELTQKVPGLLPMVAKEMPYFSKIIVHGPINGSDLLFFSEQMPASMPSISPIHASSVAVALSSLRSASSVTPSPPR